MQFNTYFIKKVKRLLEICLNSKKKLRKITHIRKGITSGHFKNMKKNFVVSIKI